MFVQDIKRTGKIAVKDVVLGSTYSELLEVYEEFYDHKNNEKIQYTNWFHFGYSMHVYDKYLLMDNDKNGMLSKNELMN